VTLTAVFERVPDGFVAYVEELPGANTQGATLEDASSTRRSPRRGGLGRREVIRETFRLGA